MYRRVRRHPQWSPASMIRGRVRTRQRRPTRKTWTPITFKYPHVKICLPNTDQGYVCQPWGVSWQQVGTPLRTSLKGNTCGSFNVQEILNWYEITRKNSPIVNMKNLDEKIRIKRNGNSIRSCLSSILSQNVTSSWERPQFLETCAFVGSGLLTKRKYEIDQHDAVFRANTHIKHPSQFYEDIGIARRSGRQRSHTCTQTCSSSTS